MVTALFELAGKLPGPDCVVRSPAGPQASSARGSCAIAPETERRPQTRVVSDCQITRFELGNVLRGCNRLAHHQVHPAFVARAGPRQSMSRGLVGEVNAVPRRASVRTVPTTFA